MYKVAYISLAIVLLMQFSCRNPYRVKKNNNVFRVTQQSYLYFKNVRSFYYHREDVANGEIRNYYHKDLLNYEKIPPVYAQISHNWREDEAYLIVRIPDSLSESPVFYLNNGEEIKYNPFPDSQLVLGTMIAEAIQKKGNINWSIDGDIIPLFENQKQEDLFELTVRDYKRLTNQE